MPVESVEDHGQKMPSPTGRAVGFVDTKSRCDAVTQTLNAAGIPDAKMIVLHGEEGIQMLDRPANDFYFGDGETDLIQIAHEELKSSHVALLVEVSDRAEAARVVSASPRRGVTSDGEMDFEAARKRKEEDDKPQPLRHNALAKRKRPMGFNGIRHRHNKRTTW